MTTKDPQYPPPGLRKPTQLPAAPPLPGESSADYVKRTKSKDRDGTPLDEVVELEQRLEEVKFALLSFILDCCGDGADPCLLCKRGRAALKENEPCKEKGST